MTTRMFPLATEVLVGAGAGATEGAGIEFNCKNTRVESGLMRTVASERLVVL